MVILKIKNWYAKYERPVSSLFLIGGFILDSLTLRAVSMYWQNIWISANLIILGMCIVLIHLLERQEGDEANSSKAHFWLVNIMQFFFGGTLSTFMVFYFTASDFSASWPFLLILAVSFWANEKFKRKYVRLTFQISLYFLAIFAFAIFLLPVLLHEISQNIFFLSGFFSLGVISLFILIVRWVAKAEYQKSKQMLFFSLTGIFLLINFLYSSNLIPPLPLVLKDKGVYHSIKRQSGNYLVTLEQKNGWSKFFTLYPVYHRGPKEPVVVYSAIFSPPDFKTAVVHEWQTKDETTGEWVTKDNIALTTVGGREQGFRTYSQKSSVSEGRWRVNVLTAQGQVIGRIRFDVEDVAEKPAVVEDIKN